MRFSLFFSVAVFFWTCKAPEQFQPTRLDLSDDHKITFLDSTESAVAIVSDTVEHFFEHINALDMRIQLKMEHNASMEIPALMKVYKNALQSDVLNFSENEIDFIKTIFKDIFQDCNRISKNIFPSEIKLIKIQGSHYGDGAFYTRENCIVIPQSELQNPEKLSFRKVILHELFHIYSRYHPQKKLELYALIGFKSIGGMSFLQLSDALKNKILLNPDGINYAYSIELHEGESTFSAIPIISSNEADFNKNKTKFFDYLHFDLYKIIPPFSRMIKVVSDTEGSSTINYKNHPEFFKQITDNTGYIIHPDELMADNFVIAVQSKNNASELTNLSDSGKRLIKGLIEIIGR